MNQNNSQCRVYIDMTNLTLAGSHVAAVAKGLAPSLAVANTYNVFDFAWRLDVRALLSRVAWSGSRRATRLVACGSSSGYDAAYWRTVQQAGIEAVIEQRKPGHREKGVDVAFAMEVLHDAESCLEPGDEITLVAGDGDYVPLVRRVRERGLHVRVAFWSSAAKALKEAASEFVCLDRDLPRLTLAPYARRRAA